MRLAKPRVDIALSTNRIEPMLAFWRDEIGLPFEEKLSLQPGHEQYRFDANGSILKINHHAEPLPAGPPSGYREVLIARAGLAEPRMLADPDGNRLGLVPTGHDGITQIGIGMMVRDLAAHRHFYGQALGFAEEAPGRFRLGETLLVLEESADAADDAGMVGAGWRYITLQIFKVVEDHRRALAGGAREARAPARFGDVARFSMITDPDGNWIELSQRASLVGSID